MRQNKLLKLSLILLFFLPLSVIGQEITGTITDVASNASLPGVSIVEKGTTNGTETDFDGKFKLTVKKLPVTLVISSIGFETVEKVVQQAGEVNIKLKESSTQLDEIVITGLATSIKRKNSANSISSVSSDDLTGRTPPQTLDGALAGKFAGAQITSASGAPGGGMAVKLRGVTSINGNSQPLYIIDGVYVDNSSIAPGLNAVSGAASGGNASTQDDASNRIADLNPDDIANIEILKGASASAIYGSRAAAGVVIITTKKGKRGETKINLTQAIGWNEAINLLGQRNWTAELAESVFGEGAEYTAALNSGRLIDYEKYIYGEKGFITNTTVSASGGNEKTSFFASFTANDEDGIVKRTGAGKKSFRVNIDHKISDNIKLSITSNYVNSFADRGFFNNDNSSTTIGVSNLFTRPWDYLLPDANGNYPDHPGGNGSNQVHTRDVMVNHEDTRRLIGGASLDVNLLRTDNQSLKLLLRAGVDTYTLRNTIFFPRDLEFMDPITGSLGLDGLSANATTQNTNANYSAFLVHNYTNDNDVSFTTQAGLTNEQFFRNTIRTTSTGLIASETNVDQAANVAVNQFRLKQEDAGFFVQEEINYKDKVIGTLGLRGDKSSNNGDANELFYYPKASVALNLHSFDFWKSKKINQFKIRAAYGEAGNFAPNGALFTTYVNSLISGNVGIAIPATLGDPLIQPERQKELEFGFDASLFDNRLTIEVTRYKKNVEDLILQADNEPSSGFPFRFANAGALENKGTEITLNYKVFDNEDFTWNTNVIWFKNKSEITELTVNTFDTDGFGTGLGTFRIEEGKSATQIVGNDENGNVIQLGDSEPDFQMTFTNNFRYKNLTLSFLWHWKKGGDNVNLSRLLSDFGQTSADYDDITLDPNGTTPNGDYRIGAFAAGNPEPFVEDASYLRLREVGLYYTVDPEKLKNIFNGALSSVKVGFSGKNLINIFDYNSYDPEVSNFGSNASNSGVEVAPFPSSKRFMFHLSVGL